jgi:hypothetical protein
VGNPRRKDRGHTSLWGECGSWVWSCQVECWLRGAGEGSGEVKTRTLQPQGCGTRRMKKVAESQAAWNLSNSSPQLVGTAAEELEQTEVAEDLELLADFVADVGVVRMRFREFIFMGVDVG